MSNRFNVISESIRREYNFSNRTERRSFTRNCLGSLCMIQNMQWSHIVDKFCEPFDCFNLSKDGNLLCTGNEEKYINVYDWKQAKLKLKLKTKHPRSVYSVKFLNTGGNGMDFISAGSGHVRHTCVAPSGHYVSKRIFMSRTEYHRLLTVPRRPLEFIVSGSYGHLHLIDLRAEDWSKANSFLKDDNSYPCNVIEMAHHPYLQEFCVCSYEKCIRVYDKRNLKEPSKKLYPSNLADDRVHTVKCSYNNDGSEILVSYSNGGAYLYDYKNANPGEYLQFYDGSEKSAFEFFGPGTEYIILFDGEKIEFRDKKTNNVVWTAFKDCTDYMHSPCIEMHPELPVIATSSKRSIIDIWNITDSVSPKKFH